MSNNDQFSFADESPLSMTGQPSAPGAGRALAGGGSGGASPAQAGQPPHAPCAATCPLAQIPAKVWKDVLRRPFRKRHPVLFWSGLVLLAAVAAVYALGADDEGEALVGSERIALVTVSGPILNAEPTLEWVRKVARNPSVKGVLVRVDSPGGGAAASQEIYEALQALAQKKPLAVSMGGVAASGGLMVSMAGKRVFANPSTVTGSIGVRMDIPQLQGLMGKIGVGQETLTTAPYKDAGSYLRPLSPEQRDYFKGVLDDMHQQFVDIVVTGRRMSRERAAGLASGKVFTGREALKLGLVDQMGGQEAALDWLAAESGVPAERKMLTRPKEGDWLPRVLKAWSGLDLEALAVLAGRGDWGSPAFLYQF